MAAFQWITTSTILIVLSLIHIDASSSRFVRQTKIDQCPYPDVPICDFIQCENGHCLEDKNNIDCYKCQCAPGFTGQLCDIPITTPTGCNPGCLNGGQCQQTAINTYTCVCSSEYTGIQCETSVLSTHICVTRPTICQNGGTCTLNGANYLCNCAIGWTGTNCQTQETTASCNPNPCGAHGTCIQAILPTGPAVLCNCEAGWTGKQCDVDLAGNCPVGFCLSGGVCQLNGNIPYCVCPPTHTGQKCETLIGQSSTTTTTTTTAVSPNFTTPLFTTTTPLPGRCSANSCSNGGSCFNTGNTFICLCKQGWSGPTCSVSNPITTPMTTTPSSTNTCSPNPCNNGGTCFRHGNSYVCVCRSQYTGATCALLKTTTTPAFTTSATITCANQPCQNGGTCFNAGNSYFCYCGTNSNYSGKNCDTATLPPAANCPLQCAPGYCVNSGGTQGAYACICNGTLNPTSCSKM